MVSEPGRDGEGADSRLACKLTFGRQAGGHPVDLARDVTVDRCETECFEPPRGSGAHVSLDILAVHDHCPSLLAAQGSLCRRGAQFVERQADRAGQVLALVFLTGQDFDEGRAVGLEPLDLLARDVFRHTRPGSRGCASGLGNAAARANLES